MFRFTVLFVAALLVGGFAAQAENLIVKKLKYFNGCPGCNLSGADLRLAILSQADLTFAVLASADLRRTTFRDSDLSFASLFKADLSNADLSWSNLSGTDLNAATLTNAEFGNTLLCTQTNISRKPRKIKCTPQGP